MSSTTNVNVTCIQCKTNHKIEVQCADLDKWRFQKIPIQKAMPYLDDSQRELLMSQICGACYDQIFAE